MLRFMFVGDSMTIGSAGEYTWRYRMWQHLCATHGGPFQIVGPRDTLFDKAAGEPVSQDYADPDFPARHRRHLAGWGEGWLHMAPVIEDTVRKHRADVLLVSLGLIDLGFYTDAEQTAENVHRFVAGARAGNPRIRLALLPVIPNVRAENDPPFAAQVAHFNVLLAKAAADLAQPRSPILLATPPEDYLLDTDTYDGTHPSAPGEHKLAAAFASAMHQGWGVGEEYAAVGVG
ncbi:hypothetical protein HUT18_13225 [Streptomyces sp. NA04227]|uniref:GDSL-type esterase/lipase family protein n=1 Tax=Streptomyces sp. NA04227 TaxID=2742136 RepID=UPI001592900B|nr:GDSL-type esterase/lipase family protein [Streptomyces sp. NA04227]QKW07212.1 hypothetical protein HUT18_13225 [Streptomyces sp. NA04227]